MKENFANKTYMNHLNELLGSCQDCTNAEYLFQLNDIMERNFVRHNFPAKKERLRQSVDQISDQISYSTIFEDFIMKERYVLTTCSF